MLTNLVVLTHILIKNKACAHQQMEKKKKTQNKSKTKENKNSNKTNSKSNKKS
jgi:hypothetical protein